MGLWYHCQGWTSNSIGISLSTGCTSTISDYWNIPINIYQLLESYGYSSHIHNIHLWNPNFDSANIAQKWSFSTSEYFVNDIPRLWLVKPGSILIKEGEACILLVPFPSLVLVTGFLPPNFFIFVDKTALASGYNQYYCCLEKPFFGCWNPSFYSQIGTFCNWYPHQFTKVGRVLVLWSHWSDINSPKNST